MDAMTFDKTVMMPGMTWVSRLLPQLPFDIAAHLGCLAIAGQEGGWTFRVQQNPGLFHPAHSFWQMERLGGVAGVLGDAVTKNDALSLCNAAGVAPDSTSVWNAFAAPAGDNLACGFARLLLWADPAPLPAIGDMDGWRVYYQRNWRPGKPSEARWEDVFAEAYQAVTGQKLP